MTVQNQKLCPFSKPIVGRWCVCQHAYLMERCSGKMACHRESQFHLSCTRLVTILKDSSRFILGLPHQESELPPLTHSQTMKIRCGGVLGMQRVMNIEPDKAPNILAIISATELHYGSLQKFPYNEIVHDIKNFSHRKKSH